MATCVAPGQFTRDAEKFMFVSQPYFPMSATDLAAKLGLHVPTILLPKEETDYTKWACIACDQFTSEPEYWQKVEDFVGAESSTYKLILPEVFLETDKEEGVIANVKKTMEEYKENNVLVCREWAVSSDLCEQWSRHSGVPCFFLYLVRFHKHRASSLWIGRPTWWPRERV